MGLHWRLRHPEALRHLSGAETAEALFTDLCIKQTNLTFLSYLTKQPFLFISLGEGPLLCIKLLYSAVITLGKTEGMMGKLYLMHYMGPLHC